MLHSVSEYDLKQYKSKSLRKRLRVIALDNEESTLTALSFLIEAMGHRVAAFTSATEALKSTEKGSFHIALIDYRLAGDLNGVNVIKKIHKISPRTECFLITGEQSIDGKSSNAINIINKPLTDKKLQYIFKKGTY